LDSEIHLSKVVSAEFESLKLGMGLRPLASIFSSNSFDEYKCNLCKVDDACLSTPFRFPVMAQLLLIPQALHLRQQRSYPSFSTAGAQPH